MSEDVAEVLARHQRVLDGPGSCRCGAWPPSEHDIEWPDHLAEALAPLIAERERVAAERNAAEAKVARVEALADEWAAVSVTDEWDAADRWSEAHGQLRAALSAPQPADAPEGHGDADEAGGGL